jgi:MFS family permease
VASLVYHATRHVDEILSITGKLDMKSTLKDKKEAVCRLDRGNFLWFVLVAYVTQGIAQHFCLVAQPLDYFLLQSLGRNASEVAFLLSILMVPWMVKPIYGIMSDFLPLLGYRRKSYLALAYALAGCFYLVAAATSSVALLVAALFMSAVGMAIGTAIVCGLTLEVGRPSGSTRSFQSFQAVCYYSASIGSFLVGGLLCTHLAPANALHSASIIASVPCFATAIVAWYGLSEPRVGAGKLDWAAIKDTFGQLRMRGLFTVALFLCCWHFSPGFGTPLYFHETKVLGFSQLFIGQLGAINSLGMILGALTFKHLLDRRISPRNQAVLAVLIGTVSTFSYLLLFSEFSAVLLEFLRGFANIIAILTVYGLAADVSPRKLESTTIAMLISAFNIAEQAGNNLGAYLYTYLFKNGFPELIILSALVTMACILLVPLLPEKDQHSA